MNRVTATIARDLNLDVARALEPLLEVDRSIAEARQREPLRALHTFAQPLLVVDHLHALAATSQRGLEDHRVPEPFRRTHQSFEVVPLGARHHRNSGLLGYRARLALVPHP